VEYPLLADQILTLSFSEGWPILAGLDYARVGLSRRVPHFEFRISNFDLPDSSPSRVFLFTTYYSLLTASPHFSPLFHSRNKPITPLPTPSNLSTSLHPIRMRPSRSNESVSKTKRY
jgi:hypothetical protein